MLPPCNGSRAAPGPHDGANLSTAFRHGHGKTLLLWGDQEEFSCWSREWRGRIFGESIGVLGRSHPAPCRLSPVSHCMTAPDRPSWQEAPDEAELGVDGRRLALIVRSRPRGCGCDQPTVPAACAQPAVLADGQLLSDSCAPSGAPPDRMPQVVVTQMSLSGAAFAGCSIGSPRLPLPGRCTCGCNSSSAGRRSPCALAIVLLRCCARDPHPIQHTSLMYVTARHPIRVLHACRQRAHCRQRMGADAAFTAPEARQLPPACRVHGRHRRGKPILKDPVELARRRSAIGPSNCPIRLSVP